MTVENTLTAGPEPSRLKIWIEATRPYSFTASVTPVFIGSVLGAMDGLFSWGRFLLALFGSLFIHIGTNLVNDYYDHKSGVDTIESKSGSQVIQRGLLTADEVYWGGIATFGIGSLFGLVLVGLCGWPILALGIASVLAGYFYTANPLSLAYIALGEATVFVFMGPVIIIGAYYVQREVFSLAPLLISLPVGCVVAAILQANNIRDIEADKAHGKNTLATVISRRAANWELGVLIYGAFVLTGLLVLLGYAPWPVLLTLLSIRLAIPVVRIVFQTEELQDTVEQCAKLHLEYGVLLIIGMLISRFLG
jgi:1,4-dihydroxy-2-naphthoate octaprenyltransferase